MLEEGFKGKGNFIDVAHFQQQRNTKCFTAVVPNPTNGFLLLLV